MRAAGIAETTMYAEVLASWVRNRSGPQRGCPQAHSTKAQPCENETTAIYVDKVGDEERSLARASRRSFQRALACVSRSAASDRLARPSEGVGIEPRRLLDQLPSRTVSL